MPPLQRTPANIHINLTLVESRIPGLHFSADTVVHLCCSNTSTCIACCATVQVKINVALLTYWFQSYCCSLQLCLGIILHFYIAVRFGLIWLIWCPCLKWCRYNVVMLLVVLQVIGPNRFHIIAYHVLIGNQVIVRCSCKLLVRTILDCLQVLHCVCLVSCWHYLHNKCCSVICYPFMYSVHLSACCCSWYCNNIFNVFPF